MQRMARIAARFLVGGLTGEAVVIPAVATAELHSAPSPVRPHSREVTGDTARDCQRMNTSDMQRMHRRLTHGHSPTGPCSSMMGEATMMSAGG